MMSLQTSTHSSQMKTVGPAISLRTSFWSLLQNEQRRISGSPFFFTMVQSRGVPHPSELGSFPDDIINNTVFLALVGRHDVIALCIILDALKRLTCMVNQDFVDPLPHAQDLLGRNINIGRLAPQTRHQG